VSATRHRLVTEVRDLLDAVAREAPEAVSAPVHRGDVTTNVQADAIIMLDQFLRRPGSMTAGYVRAAIGALERAITGYHACVRARADTARPPASGNTPRT
jgi:hypothetical protein